MLFELSATSAETCTSANRYRDSGLYFNSLWLEGGRVAIPAQTGRRNPIGPIFSLRSFLFAGQARGPLKMPLSSPAAGDAMIRTNILRLFCGVEGIHRAWASQSGDKTAHLALPCLLTYLLVGDLPLYLLARLA